MAGRDETYTLHGVLNALSLLEVRDAGDGGVDGRHFIGGGAVGVGWVWVCGWWECGYGHRIFRFG